MPANHSILDRIVIPADIKPAIKKFETTAVISTLIEMGLSNDDYTVDHHVFLELRSVLGQPLPTLTYMQTIFIDVLSELGVDDFINDHYNMLEHVFIMSLVNNYLDNRIKFSEFENKKDYMEAIAHLSFKILVQAICIYNDELDYPSLDLKGAQRVLNQWLSPFLSASTIIELSMHFKTPLEKAYKLLGATEYFQSWIVEMDEDFLNRPLRYNDQDWE